MSATARVRNYLGEYSKPMSGSELGPEDYRVVLAVMRATLSSSATSSSPTYRVPSTHNLLIDKLVGFVCLDVPASETLVISNLASAETKMSDRELAKAGNCRVDLQNSDRKQKMIDEVNVPLSFFMKYPIEFTVPHVVPAGETLQCDLALKSTEASIVGAASEYGIVAVSTLVRVKAS